jgi:hypothetical protein
MVAVMIHDVEYREEIEHSAKEIIDKEDLDQMKDHEYDFNGGSDDS